MTYEENATTINRYVKGWKTLAYIDHPNHDGWSIRFAVDDNDNVISVEYFDENEKCHSWQTISQTDKRCYANNKTDGLWDIDLYLNGRFILRPSPYSWRVSIARIIEETIQSRNAIKCVSR